jgi:DNA replication protein DnaC
MDRSLVLDLATGAFIDRNEDALFSGPPGTGKSHLAQAIGQDAIQQGYRVLCCETYTLLDELADATLHHGDVPKCDPRSWRTKLEAGEHHESESTVGS